jgi:hypothetical protein
LKRAVDEALLELQTGSKNLSLRMNIKKFPAPKPRVAGYDVVASNGGVWFYVPPMITFFILLTEIVTEKVRFFSLFISRWILLLRLLFFFLEILSTLKLIFKP